MLDDRTSSNMLEIDNVHKEFMSRSSTPLVAVSDVSFSLSDGQFVCIVGPSGCGKTTVLKMLAGLRRPTSGSLKLANEEITEPRSDVGVVFQSPVLLPWFNILENVLLPIRLHRRRRARDRDRAMALLDQVGLHGFEHAYPRELSGGMQQRVGIARALVTDPRVLLMDEPFGALDAMTRQTLNVELLRIWQASLKTVVLVTHDISEAVLLADRVLVMSQRPSTILDDIEIRVQRPRDLSVTTSGTFVAYVRRIQELLGLYETDTENERAV